jgi:hypothetical protein
VILTQATPLATLSETAVAVPAPGALGAAVAPDLATELLTIDVKSEIPATVPPKQTRAAVEEFLYQQPEPDPRSAMIARSGMPHTCWEQAPEIAQPQFRRISIDEPEIMPHPNNYRGDHHETDTKASQRMANLALASAHRA